VVHTKWAQVDSADNQIIIARAFGNVATSRSPVLFFFLERLSHFCDSWHHVHKAKAAHNSQGEMLRHPHGYAPAKCLGNMGNKVANPFQSGCSQQQYERERWNQVAGRKKMACLGQVDRCNRKEKNQHNVNVE
jgi:hypothetical protein